MPKSNKALQPTFDPFPISAAAETVAASNAAELSSYLLGGIVG